MNEILVAASMGSTEHIVALLSKGIDVDEAAPNGTTALMFACSYGRSRAVKVLLTKGANVSLVNYEGVSPLHFSAQAGHLAASKLIVKAGADLEMKTLETGSTPLHVAAEEGHSEIMEVLIDAGANRNSRRLDGGTPLYKAAEEGHLAAVKVLLRAKADPLLAESSPAGDISIPLDAAAVHGGHVEIVRELIQEYGIEGCGGASGGVNSLEGAAYHQQVQIMGMLTSAGVVDTTGTALHIAVVSGRDSSVKFLLQGKKAWKAGGQGARYLETLADFGATPLTCSIRACLPSSPRISRLLVDAGADTTKALVRPSRARGIKYFNGTPLGLVDSYLYANKVDGKDATESQLHSLEATRRLLMRVEAVHAVSWLWASDVPSVTRAAAAEGTGEATNGTSTPLISMLPILRRRAGRPRVLLAALSSWVGGGGW